MSSSSRNLVGWGAAVGASVLLHAFLLLGLSTRGWDRQMELSPAWVVDLLAPSTSIAALRAEPKPQVSQQIDGNRPPSPAARTVEPLNESREDTIQLHTRRLKYRDYTGRLKRLIYNRWSYPEPARRHRLQGQLLVEFAILGNGKLADIKIISSSGQPLLDEGAVKAVVASEPFPPLPAHLQLDRLNIRARFLYRLAAKL